MRRNWSDHELMQLGFLINAGFTNVEIARILKRGRNSVQLKASKLYGGNSNYHRSILKHKHLREPVFRYFMTHSWDETKKKFNLKDSELKSIFTVGYRDPKLKHLRKDKRTKEPWSKEDYLILLQSAGIKPRSWVAKKLKRGNAHSCVKERLERLGVSSRTLNGLTMTSYRAIFDKEPRLYLKTSAGPTRMVHNSTFFKIVPWYQLQKDLKEKYVTTKNKAFIKAVDTMVLFQNWIFDGNAKASLRVYERTK